MPTGPPGDPPQLEELLGEPWRVQAAQLRRYVRETRDVDIAELLSLAFVMLDTWSPWFRWSRGRAIIEA
jgi:hypothetical protein